MTGDPVDGSSAQSRAAHARPRPRRALRGRRGPGATGCQPRSCARAAARSGSASSRRAEPELVAAAPHADGWRSTSSASDGSPPPASCRAVAPLQRHAGWVDALLATAETVEPAVRPDARGLDRGDRDPAALARVTRACAWCAARGTRRWPERRTTPRRGSSGRPRVARPAAPGLSAPRLGWPGDHRHRLHPGRGLAPLRDRRAIADIDGVSEVYSVTGDLDLVAMVRVRTDRRRRVGRRRPAQQGRRASLSTQTQIAYRAFSQHDLEDAFSIGL